MTKGKFRRYIESLHPSAEDCAKDTDEDGTQRDMEQIFPSSHLFATGIIPRGIAKLSQKL